ncbi:hypothetical protein LCGC14_1714150 [marine sediment metagenome]|uniref:Uncharacterized protein n=1 Tax=marine sediment metagenome TaxID=412755 RepID=A0A0F9JUV4_9ZZZZ
MIETLLLMYLVIQIHVLLLLFGLNHILSTRDSLIKFAKERQGEQ